MFKLLTHKTLPSTQDHAKQLINSGEAHHGMVIHAELQTNGYGRLRREWVPKDGNLYISIIAKPEQIEHTWAQLSFVTSVALYNVVASYRGLTTVSQDMAGDPAIESRDDAGIVLKWPNDVLFKGKKCAGILIEIYKGYAVIGIGVNTVDAPEEGIALDVDTQTFLDDLLKNFEIIYQTWNEGGWQDILQSWQSHSMTNGQSFQVTINGAKQTVIYDGVTDNGFLKYRDKNNTEHILKSGDVFLATKTPRHQEK
jgi:BirA family biotin operon repressor/biotin-[acetyl-CoA-carboxylase] ligase